MQLTEEQQMLQDMAARLLTDMAPITRLRELRDVGDANGYDTALWSSMAEAGLTGIVVPEAHGGMAFGLFGAGLVARELGRTLAATPFVSTAVLGTTALAEGGTPEQQGQWLPAIAAGEALVALAVDEGAKHRPEAIVTSVTVDGGYALSGDKVLVVDGHVADLLLVSARDGNGQPALFAVAPDTPGVTIEPTHMVDNRKTARIRFEGSHAKPLADGARALAAALHAGRAVLAAELAGLSREAFDRTLAYLQERKQFGRPIASFQALQHRAAHLAVEIEMADALAMQALRACDTDAADAHSQVLAAKAKAARAAQLATAEAIQMHGGIGMTDEFDIGFFIKRARAAGETLGDANYCADRFAAAQGY